MWNFHLWYNIGAQNILDFCIRNTQSVCIWITYCCKQTTPTLVLCDNDHLFFQPLIDM